MAQDSVNEASERSGGIGEEAGLHAAHSSVQRTRLRTSRRVAGSSDGNGCLGVSLPVSTNIYSSCGVPSPPRHQGLIADGCLEPGERCVLTC